MSSDDTALPISMVARRFSRAGGEADALRLRRARRKTCHHSRRRASQSSRLAGPGGCCSLNPSSTSRGIAAHLALACTAVAALALGANTLVREGSLVVHTIEVPAEALTEAPAVLVQPPIVATSPVDSSAVTGALQHYAQAVFERSDATAGASTAAIRSAADALRREFRAYTAAAGPALEPRDLRRLRDGFARHGRQGDELVRLADARVALLQSCQTELDALGRSQREAVEKGWKIFGRVLARQSLLEIGHQIDTIRGELVRLAAPDGHSSADPAALMAAESALLTALDPGQIPRSGDRRTWFEQNHERVRAFIGARESLVDTGLHQRRLLADFRATGASLTALLGKPRYAAVPATSPATLGTSVATIEPPVRLPRTVSKTATSLDAPWRRTALLAISAGVVALLLLLSVLMFVRIVGPVRRLMLAAGRIAEGDASQRVAHGGIRELDALALAFNRMSEQLETAQAVARDYQQRLEATVEERTRQLVHLAAHDPLTELPNRRELFSQLSGAVERARHAGSLVGVLVLDIDNFKNLNDSVGHAYGDRVLQAVAQRLAEATARRGCSARLGGDEFTVILEDAPDAEAIHAAGQELVLAFGAPLEVDGRELVISVSIGVSCYPAHGDDAVSLLRAADAALFRAKALGRSQLSLYTPDLLTAAATRFSTEQGLRLALQRDELELVFQPEVDARTLEVGLVEALLRWRLPDGRLATPGEFLAVAEESGLILWISDWVLRSAIESVDAWRRGPWPQARVAINVSVRQVLDHGFEARLLQLLERHALPPQCIELELTENVLQTGRATVEAIHRLRAAGVGIALDDFGAGYSSLASLEQLPLTRVKLDRSLVASIDTNPRSLAITRAIAGLCRQLGLEMTAEGIERPEQLALLLPHGSIFLQGYLLCRPVSQADLPARVHELADRMHSLLLSSEALRPPGTGEAAAFAEAGMRRAAGSGD